MGANAARVDVRKALHLDTVEAGASSFNYNSSGPASITLWPELAQKIRVLIFNGDADGCVPYIGNEQWIADLEEQGSIQETHAWAPWFTSNKAAPAGYITRYQSAGTGVDFSFQTIRLAGHMVPTFQPEAGFVMIKDFFSGNAEASIVV